MRFREFWKQYFIFNRSERRAIRLLLVLIVIIILMNVFMPFLIRPKQWDYLPYQAMLDSISRAISYKDSFFYSIPTKKNEFSVDLIKSKSGIERKIMPFNPNDLDEADWQLLGLSEKQANAVVKIRNLKGGFKSIEEVKQVKYISKDVMQKIEPYLIFPLDTQQGAVASNVKPVVSKKVKILDVNKATVEEWKELAGIGDKLAERIIFFREKLGGFHQITQVCEVYGMPKETCDKITPQLSISQRDVAKIQLNYASIEELARHPYISYKLASAIVSKRNARGFYRSVDELLTLGLVEKELYDKLAPYLTVE